MLSLLPSLLLSAAQLGAQQPIYVVADIHADPMKGYPISIRRNVFEDWVGWTNATLDLVEPLGVRPGFLSCGEFAEYVKDDGTTGIGADLFRRLYATSGQIASHSHNEYRSAPHLWLNYASGATYAQSRQVWYDNTFTVDQAILDSIGTLSWGELRAVNSVRGSHLPSIEADYHSLMDEFDFRVRESGPTEDFYAYFQHYLYHPIQPSVANTLVEDRTTQFVELPSGPVIGKIGVHKGILQDFRLPAAKAMFLVELLNWRHQGFSGAPGRVWVFGFAAHCHDLAPGAEAYTAFPDFCQWLVDEFEPLEALAGRQIFEFKSQYEAGVEYASWRRENPGMTSVSYSPTATDWGQYPWMIAPARELAGAHFVQRHGIGGAMNFLWEFDVDGSPAVLCWKEGAGVGSLDVTGIMGAGAVRVIDAATDVVVGTDPATVRFSNQPVLVVL